jgi:hypothetical protein
MTFELLKVCRQANPAWIELRVMYVRSTVTDRHARWVIINQKYCTFVFKKSNYLLFFYFFISFCLLFFSFHFLHISLFRFAFVGFVSFRFHFVDFVSFCFVSFRFVSFSLISFRFVSFLFRFAPYRYPYWVHTKTKSKVLKFCLFFFLFNLLLCELFVLYVHTDLRNPQYTKEV